MHPGSHHKQKVGLARRIADTLHEQENLPDPVSALTNADIVIERTVTCSQTDVPEKQNKQKTQKATKGQKRPAADTGSQPAKKTKSQNNTKTVRRKLLPQVKGQQQLTKFFRVWTLTCHFSYRVSDQAYTLCVRGNLILSLFIFNI